MCKFVANNHYRFVVSQIDLVDGSYYIGITTSHAYVSNIIHVKQKQIGLPRSILHRFKLPYFVLNMLHIVFLHGFI